MRQYLLPDGGRFYKANLHCHTTVSDGSLSPEQIKQAYMARGYSIVAYTDHGAMVDHTELGEQTFLPLLGYETEICEASARGTPHRHLKVCHACLIALDPDMGQGPDAELRYSGAGISDLMQKGRAGGFFVTYNHPAWSLESQREYLGYRGMHAMEISNHGCLVSGYEDYVPMIYDDMLRNGNRIYCISTDDNHNSGADPFADSFGGFTMIKAKRLEYRTVAEALLNGHFYASQGPEIYELYVEGGAVHIACSPAQQISFATGSRASRAVRPTGEAPLTSASFPIPSDCGYFRLTVTDGKGRHANTNGYFLDSLTEFR